MDHPVQGASQGGQASLQEIGKLGSCIIFVYPAYGLNFNFVIVIDDRIKPFPYLSQFSCIVFVFISRVLIFKRGKIKLFRDKAARFRLNRTIGKGTEIQ